jgi:hypothetical protein
MSSYELFEGKRTHGGPPSVSVTKYGNFVINSSAVELIQKKPYLQILWNKDEGKVGLKPHKKAGEAHSYHVNYSPKGAVGSISAVAFLRHVDYAFKQKETTPFAATWNPKEELLEFQLINKGGTPKR